VSDVVNRLPPLALALGTDTRYPTISCYQSLGVLRWGSFTLLASCVVRAKADWPGLVPSSFGNQELLVRHASHSQLNFCKVC
jgi:hypothetical protein